MGREKEPFEELSPTSRFWAPVVILASVAFVVAAERDIERHPSGEVGGSKGIWPDRLPERARRPRLFREVP